MCVSEWTTVSLHFIIFLPPEQLQHEPNLDFDYFVFTKRNNKKSWKLFDQSQ